MNSCPSREQFEDLLAERLSEPELATLEGHVAGCLVRQETRERLTGKDLPWQAAPKGDGAAPLPPRVGERTRDVLEELKAAGWQPAAEPDGPELPGEQLGRYHVE